MIDDDDNDENNSTKNKLKSLGFKLDDQKHVNMTEFNSRYQNNSALT